MQSKYDRVNSAISKLNNLSAIDEYAIINISNAIMNAELLILVLPQYKHDGNLDILALIHLHYQNLGAALENIPYETRKQFEDLGAIYGESRRNKYKSFTLRSTVAHYKSFYDLHANFNHDAAKNILEEAQETYQALIKVVSEFSIPAPLKKLIANPIQDKDALLHASSGFLYNAGRASDPHSPLDLLSNCREVMDVTNHCLSKAGNINGSLPMQALVILARQFIGENVRQAYYVCSADMSAFLVRVDALRRIRNKMAHKSIMFEQGADGPDGLARRFTQLCLNHSQDFDRQIKALREDAESKRPPEDENGSRYAVLSTLKQEELPSTTVFHMPPSSASSSSSASFSSAAKKTVVPSSSKDIDPVEIIKFRTYVLSRLSDEAHNASLLKGLDWDINTIYQLCIVLMNVVDESGKRKTNDEARRDFTTLSYILDNFNMVSDSEGKDLINYPMPFDYAGPNRKPNSSQKYYNFIASSPYRATAIVLPESSYSNKIVKTVYTSLLVYAVTMQNVAATKLFLDRGGQPNSFVYSVDGRALPLVYSSAISNNDECALELMDHGAILNRRMFPSHVQVALTGETNSKKIADVSHMPTFERMYREGISSRVLLAFLSNSEKHEFEHPRVLWNSFDKSVRFRSNRNESIFLLQNIAKICSERWGFDYARFIYESTTTPEILKIGKHQGTLAISCTFYQAWDQLSSKFPEIHEIAMVFLNIGAILKNYMNGACVLHSIILFDQNLVEYLCSTAMQNNKAQLKEKPKLKDKLTDDKYAKDMYTPGIFAKKLGKTEAFDALYLFATLHKIFENDNVVPLIMGYKYDEDEIRMTQTSSYSPLVVKTNEPLEWQYMDWQNKSKASYAEAYRERAEFESSLREL